MSGLRFDNTYARLGEPFAVRQHPAGVREPRLLAFNTGLCSLLGADPEEVQGHAADWFSGNRGIPGSLPVATVYAGHQFGNFVPQLGDGRAVLLGEVVGIDGRRRDIQLKGAGRTPFSRGGDGRAALGPVLREYLVSEAMHALGIPTTRALAAVLTGEPVLREEVLPGAVITRVASSHIRVGTFEFFAARDDRASLRRLVDYVIERHDPGLAEADTPALALLQAVVARQAELIAQWQSVGFVHGVMNTDNCSIAGETIDYGPCAFMEAYDPATVFSSIDRHGRYAYGNQAPIAQWNLARLAEALLPLVHPDTPQAIERATAAVTTFKTLFEQAWRRQLAAKTGLGKDPDEELMADWLALLQRHRVDWTLAHRALCLAAAGDDSALRQLFGDPEAPSAWLSRWKAKRAIDEDNGRATAVAMLRVNPVCIPRNHAVEAMIVAAREGDMVPFERLQRALAKPYDEPMDAPELMHPSPVGTGRYVTFCGT